MADEEGRRMSEEEFSAWAKEQPIDFALVAGRPVRLPEEDQRDARRRSASVIATSVLGCPNRAGAWLAAPVAALGGLEPAALVDYGEAGLQEVLRHLVREARREAGAGGG